MDRGLPQSRTGLIMPIKESEVTLNFRYYCDYLDPKNMYTNRVFGCL